MKKMPYAIIFIILLALLIFAGCKGLSLKPTEDPGEETTEAAPGAVTTTDAAKEILNGIENLTGEDGSTLYSDAELSSLYDELASSLAAEASSEAAAQSTTEEAPAVTNEPAGDDVTDPAAEGTTAAAPEENTTNAPAESTTKAPAETTTAAKPTSNQYDILRSGHFYMDGTMYADGENNPVTLGVSDEVLYMQASMDGMTMGLLVKDKKTYLLNPPTKTYCEFGSVLSGVLKKAGMPNEDEIKEFVNSMGFSEMEDLSAADSVTTGTIGSTACDVYVFNKDDGGKTRVYLNGDRLMAFEKVDADGNVTSATYITTLTSEIPTLPPQDYTKQNALSFVMSMEEMMSE